MSDLPPLHPVNRLHLEVLTDEVGIMQHAIGARPDPAHGYCTDDVARALFVDLLHQKVLGWEVVADSAWRHVRFLTDAFDGAVGRFRNFRRVDGSWVEGEASEDSQGRAMHALGEAIATSPDAGMVGAAAELFSRALPDARRVTALRARSSVLLGCDAATRGAPTVETGLACRLLAERLRSTFQPGTDTAWPWPEARLTYENGLPVRALIVGGQFVRSQPMIDMGLRILDWLIVAQIARGGHLSPIGNAWWARGGQKATFDQQPIEATALLLAAEAALAATGDDRYRAAMERSYAWFLGANDLGISVADPALGAGGDGLTPTGVNTNKGAESTIMWLIALEKIRVLRGGRGPASAATGRILAATAR